MKRFSSITIMYEDGTSEVLTVTSYAYNASLGRPREIEIRAVKMIPVPSVPVTVTIPKTPVCECFKDKHGFAGHSPWCPIKD